ncbi:MAG TPA: class I SAM-dependent methyltransferase [Candidatus Udaeobacter sp.]|nr:class I SAM-dependent methyltransferase [Candidatus Udaeobacter sp.]
MSFDCLALHYRWLETISFGYALQRARLCWIDEIFRPRRALLCGEGNGRFLCELLRAHPATEIDCLDSSAQMLDVTRHRVHHLCPGSIRRINFIHHDVRSWTLQNSYDLLVTHFFFDCFSRDDVKLIAARLARAANSNAAWLLADFVVPQEGTVARIHARAWLRVMYLFFRFATGITATELVDPTPYLEANGFAHAAQKLSHAGMLRSDLFRAAR